MSGNRTSLALSYVQPYTKFYRLQIGTDELGIYKQAYHLHRRLGSNGAHEYVKSEAGEFLPVNSLSLSFRLELIPPKGGVSHADPPSPLVSIISVFFL